MAAGLGAQPPSLRPHLRPSAC